MINPLGRKIRRVTRRSGRIKLPLKTRLLREICYALGSNNMMSDSKKIRKALEAIVKDEKLWALLNGFGIEVKKLAQYGIEQGF